MLSFKSKVLRIIPEFLHIVNPLAGRRRRVLTIAALFLLLTMVSSASSRVSRVSFVPGGSNGIYWGAWIDGNDTYAHLYGGAWADAPWDVGTLKRFETNAGKRVSIVHWGAGTPWQHGFNSYRSVLNVVRRRGDLSLVDLDTGSVALRDIAAGKYDAAFHTWAHQAQLWSHPFFLRFDAEMNGRWNPWGTTATNTNTPFEFVAAWRHVHKIFTLAHATNVTWVWCPNIESSATTPFEALYPGDGYVDWTCLDGYNKGPSSVSFASLYAKSYDHLLQIARAKPIMIGEVASLEYGPGIKALWLRDMLRQLPRRFPKIKAVVLFNWRFPYDGGSQDFELESSVTAQDAFNRGISSAYFIPGGGLADLPALAVQAP